MKQPPIYFIGLSYYQQILVTQHLSPTINPPELYNGKPPIILVIQQENISNTLVRPQFPSLIPNQSSPISRDPVSKHSPIRLIKLAPKYPTPQQTNSAKPISKCHDWTPPPSRAMPASHADRANWLNKTPLRLYLTCQRPHSQTATPLSVVIPSSRDRCFF